MSRIPEAPRRRPRAIVILSSCVLAVATVVAPLFAHGIALAAVGGMIAFMGVGILIEFRRPGQVVGRICLGLGWLIAVSAVTLATVVVLDARPGRIPPLGAVLAVVGGTCSSMAILVSGPLLISRYPDGRDRGLLSRCVDGMLVLLIGIVLLGTFAPGALETGGIGPVDNPLGLEILPENFESVRGSVMFPVYLVAISLAAIGLVRRYRRGSSVMRAQIRWFAASMIVTGGLFALILVTGGDSELNGILYVAWLASLLLAPIAIAVAILRYRLYDIDRIVSSTIAYGIVTVILFGTFWAINLLLVSQVSILVGNEGFVVAGSTLLVAALFNPLRTRVQRVIDRRFHRARYDAERTSSDFAARLRDQLDLSTLTRELASTSARAVEPTTSRVWLRPGESR